MLDFAANLTEAFLATFVRAVGLEKIESELAGLSLPKEVASEIAVSNVDFAIVFRALLLSKS